jgi:hypothetical protein
MLIKSMELLTELLPTMIPETGKVLDPVVVTCIILWILMQVVAPLFMEEQEKLDRKISL